MNRPTLHDAEGILRNGEAIDRAITETHRRVILRHRQMNVPLVIWRDGEAVEIPPESVELPVPKCWMTRGVRSREKTSTSST